MAKGTKFKSIAGIINQTSYLIKTFLGKIGEAVKNNKAIKDFVNSLATNLERLQDKIKNITPEQVDKLVTAFVNLAKAGVGLIIFGKVFSGLGKFVSMAGGLANTITTLSGAMKIFSGATTTGTAGMQMLAKAFTFLTGPVGIVIGIIGAVIAIMVVLYKKSETFRKTVNNAFSEIKKSISGLWQALKPSLEQLWNSLQELIKALEPIATIIVNILVVAIKILASALQVLIPIITQIINIVVNILTVIITRITNVVTAIITFFTETIPNALYSLINRIKEFVKNAINFFKDFPYNLGILVGKAIDSLLNFGVKAWEFVTKKIPEIVNGIINWFKQLPGKIWTFLVESISKIGQWITNMKTKISEGISKVIEKIKNAFKNLPENMMTIGKNIVEGLWNGIKNAGTWIKDKVKEFSKGILDGMKSALGIHSPSTIFRDEVGKNIALGVGEGFENNIKKIYSKMKTAIDFETQKLSTNLSTSATFGRTLNANITLESPDIYMDSTKVGRVVTPVVSKTLRTGGAY